MDIKIFIQRYKIVLVLSFLVVVLIILKLKYGNSKEVILEVVPQITPTTSNSFSDSYPEEMTEISE